MHTLTRAICVLLVSTTVFAQWSNPVQITQGAGNDRHPAIADGQGWLGTEEWLAFSRNGKNICLLRSEAFATRWSDSVFCLTSDSADNDYPSLAWGQSNQNLMLVWQSRRNGNLDIWYSVRTNGNWGTPASLTLDAEDDQRPHVVIRDSGFVVVWERNGHILFSQYVNSQWSPPELVTPTGDSLNSCPQVEIASPFPGTLPIVTWQKQKSSDTTFAVMYSYRSGNSWSSPDTVAYSGDNRNPKFFKATPLWYGEAVSWVVQASTGSSEILTRSLSSVGGLPTWEAPASLHYSWNLIRNPVVNGYIIIVGNAPPFLRFSVASWESSFLEAESIAVTLQWTDPTMLSPDLLSTNRNPDVSSGRLDPTAGFAVRFWSVWESNATDTVKLWGSNILIVLSDVPTNGTPNEFALHQNYPNPFNPRTKIVYRVGSRESVELRIFDVLGREVATLVNEMKEPGTYEAEWDANGMASGVYFYKLVAGSYRSTKKMLLIR